MEWRYGARRNGLVGNIIVLHMDDVNVREILAAALQVRVSALESAHLDSFAMMEAVCALDENGVVIEDAELSDIHDLGDLIHYAERRVSTGEARVEPSQVYQPLVGRSVRLRPVRSADFEYLYLLSQHPDVTHGWRFRATSPSPDTFGRFLWDKVLVQLIVSDPRSGAPIGLMTALNADLRSGHAEVAVLMDPERAPSVATYESLLLFVDYLLHSFPLRKLYFVGLGNTYDRSVDLSRLPVTEEGRLGRHELVKGRYEDLVTLSLYAEDWQEFVRDRFIDRRYGLYCTYRLD